MAARMKTFLQKHLDDLLYIAGGGLWTFAAYLIYPISALIVAGAFCLAAAILIGLGAQK